MRPSPDGDAEGCGFRKDRSKEVQPANPHSALRSVRADGTGHRHPTRTPRFADETDARATGPARTAASSVERPNAVAVTAVRAVRCERPAGSWPGCRHGHWAGSRSVPLMVMLFGRGSDPARRGRRSQGPARMATA